MPHKSGNLRSKRMSPAESRAMREVPADTTGLDPAMRQTLGQERRRKGLQKQMFSPFGEAAARGPAPPRQMMRTFRQVVTDPDSPLSPSQRRQAREILAKRDVRRMRKGR